MSGKHTKSVFMYIINVFHVIIYQNIFCADKTRIVIVVNRRCDVSNAISNEISIGRKLEWPEKCTGNYSSSISLNDVGLLYI